MKAYVMTTGTVFGLLTLAHLLRIAEEGPRLARDPWYVLVTVVAGVLCFWAWRLLIKELRGFRDGDRKSVEGSVKNLLPR